MNNRNPCLAGAFLSKGAATYNVRALLICAALVACSSSDALADRETIAIIGTGDMGDSFGPRLADLGYTIVYGSRTPDSDKARGLVEATGKGALATTQKEAAKSGDIVILAVGWPAMRTVAQSLGDLTGKIIIDVSDPWTQGEDGYPESQVSPSSAELIQDWNPNAKVVKALGTMSSLIIDDPMAAGGIITVPVASNDPDASSRVAEIVDELGMDPVDFGPLRMARYIETLQILYMIPILQRRDEHWEFFFRRTSDWNCKWQDNWSQPVDNADNLAAMPETQDPPTPCP